MQAVISQHSNQSHLPLVVSLTNVAVSKQRNTLQSTAATQVMHDSSGAAACRVRQHALQPSAQDRHSGMQTRMDRAVEPSSFQVHHFYVSMCTCTPGFDECQVLLSLHAFCCPVALCYFC